jgi:glycosyltransferase involved in cell wall biosynthesis
LISVIIPVHNGAAFLPAAIASVRAQTLTPQELIVVDDGSTDNSAAIAASLAATVVTQTQQGVAAARNTGIAQARGEYLAMLDADDLWPPEALQQLHAVLSPVQEAGIAHGLTQETRLLATDLAAPGPAEYLPYRFINLGAALYRREVFVQVGGFDPSLRSGEDADWFLRAYAAGVIKLPLDAVSLCYRRRQGSLTYGQGAVGLGVLRVAHKWRQRMGAGAAIPWDWGSALAYLGRHPRSGAGLS